MASCRICGREVESIDGVPQMASCPCIKTPLGQFIRHAFDSCVNPRPSLEVTWDGICLRCGANAPLQGFCAECDDVPPGVACNVYSSPKEPDEDFSEDFDA
jgi:hypothetical protein